MRSQFVKVHGEKIEVDLDRILVLSEMNIKDISEIKGLKSLANLQGLHLSGNQITEIKGLKSLAYLQGLHLSGNQITEIKGLKSLANLEYLDLDSNQITEIKGLKSLANLKELWLNDNQITEIKGLKSLDNLQALRLDDNQITEIKGLESLANLQRLSLSGNQIPEDLIKELGIDPKKYVDYCRKEAERLEGEKEKLGSQFVNVHGEKIDVDADEVLDLSDMNIKDISEIKGLKSLDNLQALRLDDNRITEIKGLESLANLQELGLIDNQITEIKGLESLANLQELSLNDNQITEIKGLESLANLKYLDLSSNQITEIKGLESLANLKYLWLNDNQITEIKGLESLANLKDLWLNNNQITEIKGLESLADLQSLSLDSNQITEIKGLESLAYLQELGLKNNQITEIKGLESLAYLQELGLKNNQITEIKGLKSLVNLQRLGLNDNQITEIKGLESLANLKELGLYSNQITEIKGLKSLVKLQELGLNGNQIPEDLIKELGFDPKKYVDYCRKEAEKENAEMLKTKKKAEDTSMIRKILQLSVDNQTEADKAEIVRSLNFSIQEANKYLELLNSPIEYESNEVPELMPKAGEIISKFTQPTLYDLLNDLELDFYAARKIGKYLIDEGLLKEFPDFPKVKVEVEVKKPPFKEIKVSGEFSPNNVEVLRGGDWKVEGSQSVFYYKVNVKNNSQFVITNIQILLTSIPRGLTAQSDRYAINNLKPGSFESPTFKLNAQESCVGDTVEGIITYTDPIGKQLTMQISPFEICYVCNLLTPKLISKREFDQKVDFMEEKKLVIDSSLNLTDLESKMEQIVRNCNFALLQDVKESQDEGFVKIEAFAEGLYDKQDVALSVAIQKVGEGSKLMVKAMSDRSEKVTDLLRDFSVKLDDIKSDTELIKEYTSQIELIFERVDDLETYLKDHLASDWEEIKDAYADYKEGIITRKQLIGIGIKTIGQRFVKKIIEKVSPI